MSALSTYIYIYIYIYSINNNNNNNNDCRPWTNLRGVNSSL